MTELDAPVRLFDDRTRDDPRPAAYGEDSFAFLNRASGPVWQRIRDELERWYAAFPDADEDLRRRFRSSAGQQHYPAWWELYLHRVFSRLGFAIEVHPGVGPDRPDFRLKGPDGPVYLEAVSVFSGVVEEGRHGALEAQVMDMIETIGNRDFMLWLHLERVGSRTPRRRAIVEPIAEWLGTLDPDAVRRRLERGEPVPRHRVAVDEWIIEVEAIALSREARGAPDHRMIGVGPASGGPVNDKEQIAKALERKRRKYREAEAPLILALLSLSAFSDNSDIEDVLYGGGTYHLRRRRSGGDRLQRRSLGLWADPTRDSGRRVTGVLAGINVQPHNCARVLPRLWSNPQPERPLNAALPFPTAQLVAGELAISDGAKTASEILGLPPDWPGPEPAFP